MHYVAQSQASIRNKKKGLKREFSKQSLQDAQSLKHLQSSISRGPSDSGVSSMSDESRSIYVINQAKKAAELAVKNRELNKQISKQRAEEYNKQQQADKEKLKNQKKKIADSAKSRGDHSIDSSKK